MKNKGVWAIIFFVFLLSACGKSPEESDKKEDVEKLVTAQQTILKASYEVHKNTMDAIKDFDEEEGNYNTLKNIIKSNQEVQNGLLEKIKKQRTTEYRTKVSNYFAVIIEDRINNYDELLKQVRMKDAVALEVLYDSIEKKEKEIEESTIAELNALLKTKKVKEINSMKK